jgi:hypothetical protein
MQTKGMQTEDKPDKSAVICMMERGTVRTAMQETEK